MNIWKKLRIKRFWNNFHFFAFLLLLCFYSIKYKTCFILLIVYLIICISKKIFVKEMLFLCLCFVLFGYLSFLPKTKLESGSFFSEVKVDSIQDKGDYYIIDMKVNKEKIRTTTNGFIYLPGDTLLVSGILIKPDSASYEGDFNYRQYLEDNDIYYILKNPTFEYIKSSFSLEKLRYELTMSLSSRLDAASYTFVKNLVLGIKGDKGEVESQLNELELSYLIAISGMHIMLLYKLVMNLVFRLTHQYEKSEFVAIITLSIYVAFITFPISAIRALFFLLAAIINKRRLLNLSKLDIWSITVIIMLIVKPKWCFDLGFILTFLVTFAYTILSDLYQSESKLKSGLIMSLIASSVCLPVLINFKYSYNLITILIGPFFMFLYSYIALPLAFIAFIFKSNIFEGVFQKIIDIQNIFSFKQISLSLPYLTFSKLVVYYCILGLIILAVYKGKNYFLWVGVMILYFLCLNSLLFMNPNGEVSIIDVGQGDSIYIRLPYNKATILIDSYNDNTDYLKSRGVSKIDYIFITHSDEDHINSLERVCKEFRVGHLVGNFYDADFLSIAYGLVGDVTTAKMGDVFLIGGYRFEILLPNVSGTEKNDNSLVIKTKLQDFTYLFTGDMTVKQEKSLMQYYPNLNIDVLKVAHHGSATSSSEEFVRWLKPKYSTISVGKNNIYSLPSSLIVERLEKYSIVYQTQYNGNITFLFSKRKTRVLVYKTEGE